MKFLCICQYGHSRSVALTRVLHSLKHEAVAVGCGTSPGAIGVVAPWADYIFVLQTGFARHVPEEFAHKVVPMDVGPDIWSNPYNQDLLKKLTRMVEDFFERLQANQEAAKLPEV